MPKISEHLALLILAFHLPFVCIAEQSSTQQPNQKTVTLSSGEWPPYTSIDIKGEGVFTQVAVKSFEIMGYSVKIKYYPWKRSYFLAANGQLDGSLAWAPTPERKKDFLFSDPVIFATKVFFHLKSFKFNWSTLEDIKYLRTIATKQYTYGEDFDQAAKEELINVIYSNSDEQKLNMLLAGRADLIPLEKLVGIYLLKYKIGEPKAARVTFHQKPLQNTPICVVISKKIDPQRARVLLHNFNSGLAKLRANGSYDKIMRDL
ncbi:transporter substrate-binding domain-containing protein [Endozoicomonas sp. SM1973]|uniref:Transporter substrate-binding domain-containing protein n=1 Tax=Spartinivicinus marinus TaxID=2994442 RepID=A0A853IHZ9_9GAMM|nr:transporter substrate-binding domain-containing protein [Spartinivicinus marinus]MCX4028559.1 transporter substrate-binding domain-containing protein [Spartinivicinus marinus]NYZ67226.1 transporter substrate-binding domain-containing protein [Spartinivicinus marinus]